MPTVFVDLDDVVANFVDGYCTKARVTNPYLDAANHGKWNMCELLGITREEFIKPLNYRFWLCLEKMPDAKPILNFAKRLGTIHFLSAPVETYGCYDGKRAWVKRHYPNYDLIACDAHVKQAMAHGESFLIDDRESNVDEFITKGGRGILVPRPWNRLHPHAWDVSEMLEIMRNQLK